MLWKVRPSTVRLEGLTFHKCLYGASDGGANGNGNALRIDFNNLPIFDRKLHVALLCTALKHLKKRFSFLFDKLLRVSNARKLRSHVKPFRHGYYTNRYRSRQRPAPRFVYSEQKCHADPSIPN